MPFNHMTFIKYRTRTCLPLKWFCFLISDICIPTVVLVPKWRDGDVWDVLSSPRSCCQRHFSPEHRSVNKSLQLCPVKWKNTALELNNLVFTDIYVTSFSSISYWCNSENWTKKRTQSESIHSIILDVHVWKAEHLWNLEYTSWGLVFWARIIWSISITKAMSLNVLFSSRSNK